MTATSARTSRVAWFVFAIAASAYFVAVVHRTALGVAGVEAIDRFAIQATALSMLSVLQISVYAALQVPAGTLLDRFGPARVIMIGSLVMALGQLLMAAAPGFGWALAARVLIGAGDAPLFIAAGRLVAHFFPPRRVPLMVQLTGLIGQGGQLATAIPVAALLHAAGWATTFGTLAALGAVAALAVWIAMLRPGAPLPVEEHRPEPASLRTSFALARRTAGVRLGFWTHMLGLTSVNTVALLWGVPFFVGGQGRSVAEASALLTTMVVAHIATGPIVGRVTGRYPLRRSWVVLGGAVVIALAWVSVLVPSTPLPMWRLLAFAAVLGAGGPLSLVGLDFARSFAQGGRLGAATGFANMGGFVGTVVGVLLVGVTLQVVAPDGDADYTLREYRIALSTLALPWLVAAVGVLRARRETRAGMAANGVLVPKLRDSLRARRSGRR